MELDTAAIMAAVAGALVAVGALPPDSAVLAGITDRVRRDWRLTLSDRQMALLGPLADAAPPWTTPARSTKAPPATAAGHPRTRAAAPSGSGLR